jgi:glycosyltransferase involved in cell wall biosynthesis
MSALMRTHHARVGEMFALPDRIVALTPWVATMLAANGVAPERIVHAPHGTAAVRQRPVERRVGPCRFVHLGRFDPVKGTHVLLAALRNMADVPCELDIFGIAQDASGRTLQQALTARAAEDQRVRFHDSLAPSDVVDRLAAYDVLVVPSQWLETGPLVVLEAFAAGVPVVASALGGLRALVRDGVDGVLVEPFDDVSRWTEALRRLALDRPLRDRLRANVASPRTMRTVAAEMHAVYSELLESANEQPSEPRRRAWS